MKQYTIFKKVVLILILLITGNFQTQAQDINFTFENAQITTDGIDEFYEVDIFISSTTDFRLGRGQLYFNYNTAAFGANISDNGGLEYTHGIDPMGGTILDEFFQGIIPLYNNFIQNDNTDARISVSFDQVVGASAIPENNVTATPRALLHIKIRYLDSSQDPMLCFESSSLFNTLFFTACDGNPSAACSTMPGVQVLNDTFDCSNSSPVCTNGSTLSFTSYVNKCEAVFTNTSTITGDNVDYLWDFGDGETSTDTSPWHQYENEGAYTVCLNARVTLSDGSICTLERCETVRIDRCRNRSCRTKVKFKRNNISDGENCIVNFFDNNSSTNSGEILSYEWDFGDGTTATGPDVNHIYDSPGSYFVCLTIGSGTIEDICYTTNCKFININNCGDRENLLAKRSFEEEFSNEELFGFELYPNPTTGKLTIELNQEVREYTIEIFSLLGRLIQINEKVTGKTHELDLSGLNKGVYFVKVINEKQVQTKRIILE